MTVLSGWNVRVLVHVASPPSTWNDVQTQAVFCPSGWDVRVPVVAYSPSSSWNVGQPYQKSMKILWNQPWIATE